MTIPEQALRALHAGTADPNQLLAVTTHLLNGLSLDALDLVEFAHQLAIDFNVHIEPDEVLMVETMEELASLVQSKLLPSQAVQA